MKVVKSYKNLEILDLGNDEFCVRKTTKFLWLFERVSFLCLFYNGTEFTHSGLSRDVTIGSLRDCERVYNANCVKLGYV